MTCVCCFETTCFGCEVAARGIDPIFEEDMNDDYEDPDGEYEP